jgi:hypothetical protein
MARTATGLILLSSARSWAGAAAFRLPRSLPVWVVGTKSPWPSCERARPCSIWARAEVLGRDPQRGRRHRWHHQRPTAGPPAEGPDRVGVPLVRHAPARLGPSSLVTACPSCCGQRHLNTVHAVICAAAAVDEGRFDRYRPGSLAWRHFGTRLIMSARSGAPYWRRCSAPSDGRGPARSLRPGRTPRCRSTPTAASRLCRTGKSAG